MSYLNERSWYGKCAGSPGCGGAHCKHFKKHLHEVYGSAHAGGPWSCVQKERPCRYLNNDYVKCTEVK